MLYVLLNTEQKDTYFIKYKHETFFSLFIGTFTKMTYR